MQAGIHNTQFKFSEKICARQIADIYNGVVCQEWLSWKLRRDAAALLVSSRVGAINDWA
jgi:hypothetical protein